jgi:CBS domain-containing protein
MQEASGLTEGTRPVIHFSELLNAEAVSRSGDVAGRVEDVIVRLRGTDSYPLVTGYVVGLGGRRVFVSADNVESVAADRVQLSKNKVDLRPFERRDGEYLLRADVLDHRFIDVPNADLVHAYDIELEDTGQGWVLARLDTRRPPRLFGLIKSTGGHAARDWKAFEPMIGHGRSMLVRRVSGRVNSMRPAQIADLLEDATKAEGGEILERVHSDPELEADVFEELDDDLARRLLGARTDAEIAAVLGRMRADDAADAIAELPQRRRQPVLDQLPPGQQAKVATLMGFNPTSAGGLMGMDFVTVGADATAAAALACVAAATGLQPEALTSVHALDGRGRLTGVARLVTLVQADPQAPIGELVDADPVRVKAATDVVDVAVLMSDYNLITIPVVDDRRQMIGLITVDDVLEATLPEDWRRREAAEPPDARGGDQD